MVDLRPCTGLSARKIKDRPHMEEQTLERYPYHIKIDLAGIPIWLHLQYEEAYRYFVSSSPGPSGTEDWQDDPPYPEAFLTETDWMLLKKHGFERCGQVEASFLTSCCSDHLLPHGRCIVHAAAFRDSRKAWIITADPKVGKSTQVRTLRELYPGTFSVICGDRPVLELADDGTVMVHPSPWNGKEAWSGAQAAPLAGIICLKRGQEDSVTRLKAKHAAIPVYRALIHTAAGEETVRLAASFAEGLLQRVPVWEFVNRDIPGSTRLLYQKVLTEGTE